MTGNKRWRSALAVLLAGAFGGLGLGIGLAPPAAAYSYRNCTFNHYLGSYYTGYFNCDGNVVGNHIENYDSSGFVYFSNTSRASTSATSYYPSGGTLANITTGGYVLRYGGDGVYCSHPSGDNYVCNWNY